MTRLTLAFAACVFVLAGAVAAWANHIAEPTAPIVALDFSVENYADNFPTDCQGSALAPKVRYQPIVTMDQAAWAAGNPSEHFSVGIETFRRGVSPKTGQYVWQTLGKHPWPHSNVPPHNASTRFNVAYASTRPGESNGGWSEFLSPGYYRAEVTILTDATGAFFEATCEFTIQAA